MPYDEAEPDDPTILVGVSIPGDEESVREMAYAYAEEFASMGYDVAGILGIFRSPYYGGAHGALVKLGEAEVRRIIEESVACFGAVRYVVRDCHERCFAIDATSGEIVVKEL